MNHIWNKRNLKPPMMASYTTRITKFPYSQEITETLNLAQKYYNNQQKFHEALLINQQILYIRHIQFRTDIGFQKLHKLNSTYKRINSMNIPALLAKIVNSIAIEKYNDSIQLPTRETFEYLLVKLMGYFKLLFRIVELSKEAGECFVKLTRLGFFIELSTMLLATLSDIYCIGSEMALKTINLYNKLVKYHPALKSSKRKWALPEDFQFPTNLGDWIPKEDKLMIKYKQLESLDANTIALQLERSHLPKIQVNKLIQQTDIEMGSVVSRSDVAEITNIVKHKKKKIK